MIMHPTWHLFTQKDRDQDPELACFLDSSSPGAQFLTALYVLQQVHRHWLAQTNHKDTQSYDNEIFLIVHLKFFLVQIWFISEKSFLLSVMSPWDTVDILLLSRYQESN